MKALFFVIFIACSQFAFSQSPLNWRQTNGPLGGALKQVAVDSKGDAYALSEFGQLFRNKSGDDSWTFVKDRIDYFTLDGQDKILAGIDTGGIELYDTDFNFVKEIKWGHFEFRRKFIVTNAGDIYVNYFYGESVYYSSDNGATWKSIECKYPEKIIADSGNTAIIISRAGSGLIRLTGNGTGRDSLTIVPNDTTIYPYNIEYNKKYNSWIAACSDRYVYVSIDSGKTWLRNADTIGFKYGSPMYIAKSGESIIYNNDQSHISFDGGYTWSPLPGFDSCDAVDFVEINNGNLLAATKSGAILYERAKTKKTEYNKGLIISSIQKVAIDKDGVAFAAALTGLFKSTDRGNNWNLVPIPESEDNTVKNIFCSKSGALFVNTVFNSWISLDKGATWRELIYMQDSAAIPIPIKVLTEDNRGRLYGVGSSIFYSDDGAQTWDTIMIENMDYGYNATIATYQDRLAVGSYNDGVFYSTDRGATFRKLPINVPENYGNICRFNSHGDFFVAMTAWQGGDAIFRSTDGCNTFDALPGVNRRVAFLRIDSSDYIYTQGGYFSNGEGRTAIRSKDNGDTWELVTNADNNALNAADICFGPNNDAFMGTANNGVFRTDEVKSLNDHTNNHFAFLNVSPNPANDVVTLRFEKTDSPVSVIVYNQLGEAVLSIERTGSDGSLILQTNELSIGSYTAVARTKNGVLSGRFMIIR